MEIQYDIALSFAGEDRSIAETIAVALKAKGAKVFYDDFEKGELWGKDLYQHLTEIYQLKAKYCLVIVSKNYVKKNWTKHELRSAQARAFTEIQGYILPLRLDDTEVPGILDTIGYMDLKSNSLEDIINIILEKVGKITTSLDAKSFESRERNGSKSELEMFEKNINSGFHALDLLINGLPHSDLIVIASVPSMGKSDLALNIARYVSVVGKGKVIYFSLESSSTKLTMSVIAAEAKVDRVQLRTGYLKVADWEKVTKATEELLNSELLINDENNISVDEIEKKSMSTSPDLIIIDSLHLLNGEHSKSEYEANSKNIKQLKNLAKKFKCPVIVLAHLPSIKRNNKRPHLFDLNDTGDIESIADVILLLYRDDYYYNDSENSKVIEVLIAKNRNGPIGTIELAYLMNYGAILNFERSN